MPVFQSGIHNHCYYIESKDVNKALFFFIFFIFFLEGLHSFDTFFNYHVIVIRKMTAEENGSDRGTVKSFFILIPDGLRVVRPPASL